MIGHVAAAAALFAFSRGATVGALAGSARLADGFVEIEQEVPVCRASKVNGATRIAASPEAGELARPEGTIRQVFGCGSAAKTLRTLPRGRSALPGAGLRAAALSCLLALAAVFAAASAPAEPALWKASWPVTDFSKKSVEFSEIRSGGPPKDGIPPIDRPRFVPQAEYRGAGESEPVIAFARDGDARAYPLRILIWHEIVNDVVGGIPVSVTYCPLCNSAIVFDRRLDGKVLDFGTTGKLRNSDLVMYDRQTESWWQQFMGEGIVGEMTGRRLRMLPARVESLSRFRARFPGGSVLVPDDPGLRPYGVNPYVGYDTSARPFLYDGDLPEGIAPLAYVVRVGDEAWPLGTLRTKGRIVAGDLVLSWSSGRNSALDQREIGKGRDIGNVVVLRRTSEGLKEEVHDLTFAFVFHAFVEGGTLHE